MNTLQEGDLLFALSQHPPLICPCAAATGGDTLADRSALFCYRHNGTALALHTVSAYVCYPLDREISEVLLQLPELQTIAGKRALILRGNGGRELLGETLRERGADVTFVECYQRCAKHYDGAEEAMRWHARGINTLVVTSGEMLQQLWSLIPRWYRENWLLRCRLLVVSERLANLARELGWQEIRIADNADNDALLAHYNNSQMGSHNDGNTKNPPTKQLGEVQQKVATISGTDAKTWLLSQADFLVKLAGRKLWSDQDVTTAAAPPKSADASLADMNDPQPHYRAPCDYRRYRQPLRRFTGRLRRHYPQGEPAFESNR